MPLYTVVLSTSLKTVKAGRGGACVSHGTLKAEAGGSLSLKPDWF